MPEKNEKIGALWLKTSDRGDYFTEEINGQKVVVFPNGFKQSEKHPDWVIYKSRPRDAQ